MKAYLFILIIVLCFTCWLGDSGAPPMPQGIGIGDISPNAYGVNKKESMIPDFVYTDERRDSGYIVKIDEKSSQQNIDFPMGIR